jgi:hypothetical protein
MVWLQSDARHRAITTLLVLGRRRPRRVAQFDALALGLLLLLRRKLALALAPPRPALALGPDGNVDVQLLPALLGRLGACACVVPSTA